MDPLPVLLRVLPAGCRVELLRAGGGHPAVRLRLGRRHRGHDAQLGHYRLRAGRGAARMGVGELRAEEDRATHRILRGHG